MTRPTLVLGAAILAIVLGGSAWWLTRRDPGTPPQEEALEPFRVSPQGAGQLIDLQPPPTPLRSVRWTSPLPGGAAVAQILTQTGRQQAVLFQQGVPDPVFTLPAPSGVSDTFFRFADLVDAALVPGEALVLLYRSPEGGTSPGLLLTWDLHTRQVRWSHRAPGEHLALAPDRRSVFLYGTGTPIVILDLADHAGSRKPAPTTIQLPPEVKGITSLLPLSQRTFLVAHEAGLSTWRNGGWSHVQAPPPSPLGFLRGSGLVAGPSAKAAWWQPEPGTLIPLGQDGKPGEPRDLKPLFPEASSLDAGLLRLIGEDADGHLWFSLARPSLPAPPPPPPPPVSASPESPEAALPAAEVPAPPVPAIQPSREAWEAHLAKGLDRLYVWKPGEDRMKVVPLAEAWKRLAPPSGIPGPPEGWNLRPEAGTILCGGPDRVWWLPLKALLPR